MTLSHIEQMFIAEYIANGGNGTQAYIAVHPNAKPRSAAVSATRLLQKPALEDALQAHSDKRMEANTDSTKTETDDVVLHIKK